nr:EOG090X0N7H [Eulimnadia texana]
MASSLVYKLISPLKTIVSQSPANLRSTAAVITNFRKFYATDSATAPAAPESTDPDMPIDDMQNPFEKEKRSCILCNYDVDVDYKNIRLLSQFISPFTGKIYERNITGLCKEQQKRVEIEIYKARRAGYMPYMLKQPKYLKDPKICDPNRPVRPHRF